MRELQPKEEKLLMAALRLFNEYGFHNTPTSKISKEAGVSTGTLYNYFESKEELINSLYLYIKQHSAEYVRENLDMPDDYKEGLKRIWTLVVKWGFEYPEFFKFKESFCQSPFIDKLEMEKAKAEYDFLGNYLQAAMESGVVREIDEELFGTILQGVMVATIKYINKNDLGGCTDTINRSFDVLWNGIGGR
ncbi:MAG TPA: TetR/AcrR family transcriptional regulator [Thermotogota bacterium]|nr:TetR/AcrR family transcriptional regulator [Thermotogota bacterium]